LQGTNKKTEARQPKKSSINEAKLEISKKEKIT